jgi:putative methionine-R-sulfoxide reductase with GAF domain
MELRDYLNRAGLAVSSSAQGTLFEEKLKVALAATPAGEEKLLSYVVPTMTPDGTCSMPDDLDPTPYDVGQTLRANGFSADEVLKFVSHIDRVVEFLHAEVASDWTGIYKKMETKVGPALVKIAYRGRASRAEFPLTEAFAAHSNNSTVGLSGKAVMVTSVAAHIAEGKPYYECDDAVQSELCVPIYADDGSVAGIIDLESFTPNHFDATVTLKAAMVCASLKL